MVQNTLVIDTYQHTLTGQALDESGIASVTVNGQRATVDKQGYFSAALSLHAGKNPVKITATDMFNNRADKTVALDYQPQSPQPIVQPQFPQPVVIKANKPRLTTGDYYALVIGINRYPHLTDLDSAVNDAQAVAKVLKNHYGFTVTTLLNQQATRQGIVSAFNQFNRKLGKTDNFLVYYAGHGYYEDDTQTAYWMPTDAKNNEDTQWIISSRITSYLKRNKARNILIVSDSCYSGTFAARSNAVKLQSKQGKNRHKALQKILDRQARILIG